MHCSETEGSDERRSPDGTVVSVFPNPRHHTNSASVHRLADFVQRSEDKLITNPRAASSSNYISKPAADIEITSDVTASLSGINTDCSDSDVSCEHGAARY